MTPFATLPVIVIGMRHGVKWGVSSALVYSLLQMFLGISNFAYIPARTAGTLILCAALDYIVAYTLIGFTGAIARKFKTQTAGISIGIVSTGLCRLACSFLSGVLIWGAYAWDGWSVVPYSLTYNALWCLPDTALTLAACLLLVHISSFELLPS